MKSDLQALRVKCPLPVLMSGLGLRQFAKSSCPSPFRNDQHSSWGIFQTDGFWLFKDFATGESGDEIEFLAKHFKLDPKRDFLKLLDHYKDLAKSVPNLTSMPVSAPELPDTSFLGEGTEEQMKKLADLRKISELGLAYAYLSNHLKYGKWHGYEVYAVTDKTGHLTELRRLDGHWFEPYGDLPSHKSHTVKNSRKNWPVGILDSPTKTAIALVEGMPDFLALHQIIMEEKMVKTVLPVAMLTSSCDIAPEALPHFAGKKVRVFPHLDLPGINAAERWHEQLISVGADVDFFNYKACEVGAVKIKDLCDFNQLRGAGQLPKLLTQLA